MPLATNSRRFLLVINLSKFSILANELRRHKIPYNPPSTAGHTPDISHPKNVTFGTWSRALGCVKIKHIETLGVSPAVTHMIPQ